MNPNSTNSPISWRLNYIPSIIMMFCILLSLYKTYSIGISLTMALSAFGIYTLTVGEAIMSGEVIRGNRARNIGLMLIIIAFTILYVLS